MRKMRHIHELLEIHLHFIKKLSKNRVKHRKKTKKFPRTPLIPLKPLKTCDKTMNIIKNSN